MKVVILAGGFGTRLSEETRLKPKPMVEIGDMPILWHIMKIYSTYGFNEFVICLGYKGHMIKEFFSQYLIKKADVTFDLKEENEMEIHRKNVEPWKVTLVETGPDSMTGGRLLRVKPYLNNETFMLTYGDGLSNVKISDLVRFHKSHGKLATLTAVQPDGRFGSLDIAKEMNIRRFQEKPQGDGHWVNGGFFVLEPAVLDYLTGDACVFETDALPKLAEDQQLMAYKHQGFWKPMDTLNDRNKLEELWKQGNPPWRMWSNDFE
ncbi:glucose-1-phosphate cytidylyltransferase [Halalkalibacter akibai]|uniref:Glucose-1-phosphate cytidylyltransferase n=1 Tax=Halalkalibacter akibai (strain ATCC 43226 / DSM 21942 / CIP 109018 / JCM 9157 / 1139) TaxID=1236973 RepID=W4QLU0_HALA3|nr:glucose-1-phosphate cytidylyltransferase [Halalkalibacter akibai]GAE33085.1 glucose-1-phosphate cytidylyltransferase [Halalkalibacter akibai JCM 9157]